MEEHREEMSPREQAASQPSSTPSETLSQGLDEAMFKLLYFQAQQGADQNSTMIMLALMNLLGIVNCLNKMLPEKQKVRGTEDMATKLADMLGGVSGTGPVNDQGTPTPSSQGGIDPSMIAALASMLRPPNRSSEAPPENKSGLDPALMTALSMMGNAGGGGANPAALMAMLANLLGPKRSPENQRHRETPGKEEKTVAPPEEKSKQTRESSKKEAAPGPRGMLKWDSRFGSPTSSF
ncbi:hypothetical protein [Desulforamulus aeronauticus]|uniref:Uncharacterized protein n=1 Tax=Desulforamulus aeronauticus DSM 10349 TaxID=1121421 RepID=A0A1M6RPQ6_9FIRM|nr:hypothetical protein [Desulforamulus aeronauticus]SHK34423.1 hypothetical protein SAMN02745123_01556 [Desulforamulus aeronauticus DSM 10349]